MRIGSLNKKALPGKLLYWSSFLQTEVHCLYMSSCYVAFVSIFVLKAMCDFLLINSKCLGLLVTVFWFPQSRYKVGWRETVSLNWYWFEQEVCGQGMEKALWHFCVKPHVVAYCVAARHFAVIVTVCVICHWHHSQLCHRKQCPTY